jgi:hypothetical protein
MIVQYLLRSREVEAEERAARLQKFKLQQLAA